jgi:hypothetical protein
MTRYIAPFGIVLAAVGMLAACTVASPSPWPTPVAADGSGGGDSGAKAPRK